MTDPVETIARALDDSYRCLPMTDAARELVKEIAGGIESAPVYASREGTP